MDNTFEKKFVDPNGITFVATIDQTGYQYTLSCPHLGLVHSGRSLGEVAKWCDDEVGFMGCVEYTNK